MQNVETVQSTRRFRFLDNRLPDVTGHRLGHFGKKRLYLGPSALDHQLHPAIGKVLDVASHLESPRHTLGRIAETDALHVSRVVDFAADKR